MSQRRNYLPQFDGLPVELGEPCSTGDAPLHQGAANVPSRSDSKFDCPVDNIRSIAISSGAMDPLNYFQRCT